MTNKYTIFKYYFHNKVIFTERVLINKTILTGHNVAKLFESVKELKFMIYNNTYYLNDEFLAMDNKEVNCYIDYFSYKLKKSLDDSIFEGNENLLSIYIPEGIKKIGAKAFKNCGNLESVHLPSTLQKLGDEAFNGCTSLEKINLPEKLKKLPNKLFNDCISLKELIIPYKVKEIDLSFLNGCYNLGSLNVDIKNKYYDSRNDSNALLESATNTLLIATYNIIIPNTTEIIANNAFSLAPYLKDILLPKSIERIKDNAFNGCKGLENIFYEGTKSDLSNVNNQLEKYTIYYYCPEKPGNNDLYWHYDENHNLKIW